MGRPGQEQVEAARWQSVKTILILIKWIVARGLLQCKSVKEN